MKILIAFAVTLLCFLLFFLLLKKWHEEQETVRKRIAGLETEDKIPLRQLHKPEGALQELLWQLVQLVARQLRKVHNPVDLDFKMQQADWPLLGSEFLVLICGFGAALGVLLFLLTLKPVMLLLGSGLGVTLGIIILKMRIQRRRAKFVNQLGDCLMMVANALRSGFSFLQAMELVSQEMEAPLGLEFRKVIGEMSVGASLESALGNMSRRMDSPDFELVTTAVLIQRQVGGNLSQILDTISETIRARVRMKKEIMTLTAQGRLSGMILLALPFCAAGFIITVNPEYFQPMLAHPVGQIALLVGVLLEFIGFLVIRRIVDIENN